MTTDLHDDEVYVCQSCGFEAHADAFGSYCPHCGVDLDELESTLSAPAPACNANEYLVVNENTLGYRKPGSMLLGVLHASVIKGGHNWLNGPVLLTNNDKVRPATLADFAEYRVSPKGHLVD